MKLFRILDEQSDVGYAAEIGGALRRVEGDLFGGYEVTGSEVVAAGVLAPVDPPNIFAVGRNYREHAQETDSDVPAHPVVFAKATSSLNHPGNPIILPAAGPDCVDYEAELAVVIATTCRNVRADQAHEVILGYTVANDVSARDWQKALGQWVRAKSFDTFCPLGPCIETQIDPADLRLTSTLNGQVMQDARTSEMIFPVARLVEFISADLTLAAGTVILTGTPAGVGMARTPEVFLRPGDTITCSVEGIGELSNPVVSAEEANR
ncbi:MAG: fumarylacetoacetate hydrolase family protein [Planctomycetota bacterium]|jgi:2-keto-4-pentenoate hydratase/2-oxohepta-3-ene-1,7-dioic acid hydratase in catechol pathway